MCQSWEGLESHISAIRKKWLQHIQVSLATEQEVHVVESDLIQLFLPSRIKAKIQGVETS